MILGDVYLHITMYYFQLCWQKGLNLDRKGSFLIHVLFLLGSGNQETLESLHIPSVLYADDVTEFFILRREIRSCIKNWGD